MIKALLVGDNAGLPNWGRGASIALGQHLSARFDLSGRITGDQFLLETADFGYVNTFMPAKYYRFFKRALQLLSWNS